MNTLATSMLSALVLCGCGPQSAQEPVSIPLYVAGSGSERFSTESGNEVILERAELAFGPLYLCAGFNAGQQCETARLEWLETTIVDALDRSAQRAGRLEGVTGVVRSWMYDLSISSTLTSNEPVVLPAAERLGDVSVALDGRVETQDREVNFTARVALEPAEASDRGVPLIHKSSNESFAHDVTTREPGLLVRFDPQAWVRALDFDRLLAEEPCRVGRQNGCQAAAALVCDPETGDVLETHSCEPGEACVGELGCTNRLDLDSDGVSVRALRHALESGSRPEFEWGFSR